MKSADRLHVLDEELNAIVRHLPPPVRKCGSSREHERISKARADHDRVSKQELERALFLAGVASIGEQSKAARIIGVTEGALRHWRDASMTRCLPPRSAIVALRNHVQNQQQSRRFAG